MRGRSVRGARRRDRQSCRSSAATRRRPIVASKRNEAAYGRPGASRGSSAYPQLRFVSLRDETRALGKNRFNSLRQR